MKRYCLLLFLLLLPAFCLAEDFTLKTLNSDKPGPTLLVIGGIHGDEPGGFNAAALLATRYRLRTGQLWIVPDLNRTSILRRAHGWYGDMNYKFNGLDKSDRDYALVQKIKKLITDPQVDLILNLHDGSGYYSPQRQSSKRKPSRWGQSSVIDQAELIGAKFGQLEMLSGKATERINQMLLHAEHRFHVKNTHTATSDKVMQKSLTYYALRKGKPAIGLEASKCLPTHQRVYYLLTALEAYFAEIGIDFERDFPLTPKAVKKALTEDIELDLADGRIKLQLTNMRPELKHFPLEKGIPLSYSADNPLVSVRKDGERYRIYFGNNRFSYLDPYYVTYDDSLQEIQAQIDKRVADIALGDHIKVKDKILLQPSEDYRVNLIGYQHQENTRDDSGQEITLAACNSNYSVDNDGRIYRLEVYRQDKFCGMILVEFTAR
ncbi:Carboxypeptidase controlling helical cell shape [Malonomonas rubra DSM 5091]|uniref:Carboxypeptidase controlling helical cell shape n=1 Tax=Malonomonas rubra DSM 5091 TaxID=1122189 RepID=A0A1M6GGH5_MALRU|nr:M14 family metallopeptidase [Malonomonas rubra]SHJ09032.1 Carboxypeptidase controlling helical cell shape [Malonomonas rubra DSM 5091]